jgi:hypothetical protein
MAKDMDMQKLRQQVLSPIDTEEVFWLTPEWHLLKLFRVPVAQHIRSGLGAWFHQ